MQGHSYAHYDEKKEEQEDVSLLIDQGALNLLHQSLPQLMISSPKKLADQFLEMIALMGKRWVQEEWPTLIPVSNLC